jgi:hypothetical protein
VVRRLVVVHDPFIGTVDGSLWDSAVIMAEPTGG